MGPPLTLNRRWSQEVDRRAVADYGMTGLVLMENAGRGVVDTLVPRLAGDERPVIVCCGRGNNGGDGLVVARHLDLRGHAVEVLLFAEPATLAGDAAANYQIARRAGLSVAVCGRDFTLETLSKRLIGASWIVDALLGTGFRGEPRAPLDAAIDAINAASRPTLAVDLPSGLDCDEGPLTRYVVRAALTCTFVTFKAGLLKPASREFVGELAVLDIGAPRKLIEEILAEARHAPRGP